MTEYNWQKFRKFLNNQNVKVIASPYYYYFIGAFWGWFNMSCVSSPNGNTLQAGVIVQMTVNKSLLKWLLCYWGELFIPLEHGAFINPGSGSSSKFSFLWSALFLVHTHKQSLGCRHWISRLCHRVASRSETLSSTASAYINMWKAKAVPNIPSKHLSCVDSAWKNSKQTTLSRAIFMV